MSMPHTSFKHFMLKSYYGLLTRLHNLKLTRGVFVAGAGITGAIIVAGALFQSPNEAEASLNPKPAIAAASSPDEYTLSAQFPSLGNAVKTVTLKSGESLGPLLQKNGVSGPIAYQLTQKFAQVYNPRDLRAGQNISLYFDDSVPADEEGYQHLIGMSLKPNVERAIHINRLQNGEFSAKDIAITFPMEIVKVSGLIQNSLYLDASEMGVPDKVTIQFSHIYEHSVDFARDIRKDDAFTMAFELYRDRQGNPIKAGDLVYTSFSPRGNTTQYWLYELESGSENYFDAEGKGAKRKLMRTPINGARLTSSFGSRRHPVLGYTRQHNGVDFGAASGTPIMAAGVGVVERANRYGSFGNYIRISHSDGYKTAYAHLKSFARGIKAGTRVTQGQTIGYVGTTGSSTGPHLHYEVHKNGKPINPNSLSSLSGKPLPSAEKDNFLARRNEIDKLIQSAPPVLPEPAVQSVNLVSLPAPENMVMVPQEPDGTLP